MESFCFSFLFCFEVIEYEINLHLRVMYDLAGGYFFPSFSECLICKRVLTFGSKFSMLLKHPNEKKEDSEDIQCLDVGETSQRIIPGKTHAVK